MKIFPVDNKLPIDLGSGSGDLSIWEAIPDSFIKEEGSEWVLTEFLQNLNMKIW